MEDTSNLEVFLAIASFIGIFPYRNRCKQFWGFYVCCWCSFSMLLNIAAVIFEIRNRDNYFFYILSITVYAQWMLLNVLCSRNAINHVEKWKKILSAFSKYDDINPNVSKRSQMSKYYFIAVIIVLNTSFLIGWFLFKSRLNLITVMQFCWTFHMSLIKVICVVILETLTLLKRRYSQIKEEVSKWNRRVVVSRDRLGNLIERYRILYEISRSVDEIFGKVMLILLANTFLITIDLIGLTLTMKLENTTYIFVHFGLLCTLMVTSTTFIVIQYHSTERIGKEIVKFYCIHEAFNGVYTVSLVKYFDELSPKFTADGYFSLNKSVVPSLMTAIATYVVVMLQLKPN